MELKMLEELLALLEDINPVEIVSHVLDGTLISWLSSWRTRAGMLVSFLLESEKGKSSETD